LVSAEEKDLPARLAAPAAAAASPTATTTGPSPAAATAGSPAATAAATAKAIAAAATTTAKPAIGFRAGFVHVQSSAIHCVSVESGNGLIRFSFVLHLDEGEPARAPGFAVRHDSGAVHLAVSLKQAADGLFGNVEIKVADEYVFHSILLSI
jgi:hypothetical protein